MNFFCVNIRPEHSTDTGLPIILNMKRVKDSQQNDISIDTTDAQQEEVLQASNSEVQAHESATEAAENQPLEKLLAAATTIPDLHLKLLDKILETKEDGEDETLEASILKTLKCLKDNESWNSIVRGASGYELKKRSSLRLAGGRGRRDDEGLGIRRKLQKIADASGFKLKTVEDDVAIYQKLVGEKLSHLTDENTIREERTVLVGRLTLLPRCFNLIAARQPDPEAAQSLAIRRRADQVRSNRYAESDFKTDLAELFPAPQTEIALPVEATQATKNVKFRCVISCFELDRLTDCEKKTGKTRDQVIALSINTFWTILQKEEEKK
jgi:hypothetical protein